MGAATPPTPKKLADFEVIRRLGAGGMAEVFLAKKLGAEGTYKLLVVKRILPSHVSAQRFRAMFAEEAMLATRLNHPNIVQVYDFQDYGDEGQLLSMEFVDGPDLRRLYRAARKKDLRLPPFVAAWIVSEIAKGLHYAHERKDEGGGPLDIVHRDISPQNILISYDGAVKVADFGIATANLFRPEKGVLKGKTAYMSPEQANGQDVDRRTDIYALGVVFHELLTSRPLHGSADGKELLEAVRAGNVEPPSLYVRGVPAELEAIVMRALSMERENRFATGREMASAITRVLFQKQQLVDSHTLEGVIAEFVGREHTSPGKEPAQAASEAESANLELPPAIGTGTAEPQTGDPSALFRPQRFRPHVGREVRHVALIGLNIYGKAEMEQAIGKAQTSRLADQLRNTLNEIAYTHGETKWDWEDEEGEDGKTAVTLGGARAVTGLMVNPSRAATDAANIAIDVHEALAGICGDFPTELRAGISIVRGIAEGRRDKAGRLNHHALQAPTDTLVRLLGERTAVGGTWVAGGIFRLVRRDYVWSDVPNLEIEHFPGSQLPASMRVYSLVRPLTKNEQREQLSAAPRDLVGRDAELADLHAAYHQSVSPTHGGNGQFVTRRIVGEMGIGKSALMTTFLAELPPDAKKLQVECSQYRSELPFSSASQWLRELTGIQVNEPIGQAKSAMAIFLGDLKNERHADEMLQRMSELAVGQLAEAADEADATLHRRLLATGIRHLFAKAAEQSPLVVMFDNLHWIDLPSLELVATLVERGGDLPILVLLVARPDERITQHIEEAVSIELHGLSAQNQIRLVEAHIGATGGVATACADLLPRAAGNPFFLLEMVDALLERGSIELSDEGDGQLVLQRSPKAEQSDRSLPSTLEQLIADRLNELPQEERGLIDWLSVSGGPIAYEGLNSLVGDNCDEAIARLCARGVCDTQLSTVDVRHPLTRDVAYRSLNKAERAFMHQKLGEQLSQTPAARGLGAAIVARHFSLGETPHKAADFYLEAAAVARLSFQLQLAARYYQYALDVLPRNDERRLEPYSVLEDICRVQGRWNERARHLQALRDCATWSKKGHWMATALIRHAQFDFDSGRLTHGLSLAQLGEETAERAHSPTLQVQAQALMAEMLRDLGEMQGALAACDRALSTLKTANVPPRLRAEVLRAQATLLLRVGRVQEAVTAHAEAIAVFRQTGARRQEARAKNSLAFTLFVTGKFEDTIALALEAIRIDLSIGGRFQIAKTLSNIAQSYTQLGDYERAKLYFRRAREAHQRYEDQDNRADTLLCSAELHLELDELDRADELLNEVAALSEGTDSGYDTVHAKLLQATIARLRGESNRAVMYAFDARQIAESQAYVAYHFHAMALEAASRVDIGEQHTGILLATTTMGAIETLEGSEYGIQTRALCLEVLSKTGSPLAASMRARATKYIEGIRQSIRNPGLRASFSRRRVIIEMVRPEIAPSE